MVGIIIGTICLFGLVRVVGHRRGCRHRSRARDRGRGGPRGDRIEYLAERLELTAEQQAIVKDQVDGFRKRLRELRGEGKKTRSDIAAAMRTESFDENLLGEMFVRHDDAIRLLRLDLVERLAHVHHALDERQRDRLADIIQSGHGGGPYRAGW